MEESEELEPERDTSEQESERDSRFPTFELDTLLADRFLIIKELSVSDSSALYVARDNQRNHRRRTLKFFPKEISESRAAITALKEATQKIGVLQHRNLAKLLGFYSSGGTSALITEYIHGYDLADRFAGEEVPTIEETLGVMAQSLAAVSELHKNGYVHGSLKPHNILITMNGVVKITDYGYSDVLSAYAETPIELEYAPPEHFRGIKERTVARDVYALGALAYQLITHQPLFEYETPDELVKKKITDDPIPPMELNPSCPKRLSDIVMRALGRNQRERFQSAEAFLEALRSEGLVREEHFVSVIPGFRRWVGVFGLKFYQVADAATKGAGINLADYTNSSVAGDPVVLGGVLLLLVSGLVGISYYYLVGTSEEQVTYEAPLTLPKPGSSGGASVEAVGGASSKGGVAPVKGGAGRTDGKGKANGKTPEETEDPLLRHAAERPNAPQEGSYYLFIDGEFVLVDKQGRVLGKKDEIEEKLGKRLDDKVDELKPEPRE